MDTKETIIGRIVDLGFGHVVRETIQVGPTLQQQLAEMKSRAEKAEAELAGLRAEIANTVNDWRHLDGHAATPEADEMRQDCANELASLLRVAEGE